MAETNSKDKRPRWYLERSVDYGKTIQRIVIQNLPFRIGRSDELDFHLPAESVSYLHAELFLEHDVVTIRDMNSTNGTFVNRERVTVAKLQAGDILHIAEFEFRLGRDPIDQHTDVGTAAAIQTASLDRIALPGIFPGGARELSELLEKSLTFPVLQPIVTLPEARVVAYEVLGRGEHPSLPRDPQELLRIAESVGLAAELNRVFRRTAVELVKQADKKPPLLFLNTHPTEIGKPELVESLEQLRQTAPDLEFALEIHEGSVAEIPLIAELKTTLEELRIALAYEDFGLGERFLQLADVAPDYLKFDIHIVKRIVAAAPAERRLLSTLVDATREIGSISIAGGVETQMEADVCCSLGFQLAQGYVYSKPLTLDQIGQDGAPLEVIRKSAP